ncbi:MAG: phage tail length tape measure family protein [Devosiaceae bacterium]|nr:phage tail length tape measure family protein [Devosiaceae bacterium MH13]
MDIALIGLAADSAPIKGASQDLDEFTASSKRADAANDDRARSHRAASSATAASTAATKANTAALQAQAAASRAAAFRQRMLAVQSLDVAQSLALGMNPMMVAIQQGGQLAGIYAGQGGVAGAFKEASASILGFARAHPAAIAVTTALALAVGGLRNELEETTGSSVTLGQTVTAVMQEILASVNAVAAPAVALLGRAFAVVANSIFDTLALVGNSIVNTFEFAYRAVIALWDNLPEALGDLAFSAAQRVADAVNPVLAALNMPTVKVNNPFEGEAAGLQGALGAAYEVFENDRVGEFIDRVSTRLETLQANADGAAEALGRSADAANNNRLPIDLLGNSLSAANDNLQSYQSVFTGFFQDFNSQIQSGASFWEAFSQAGMNALNQISSMLIEMAAQNLFASAFGGGASGGSNWLSGLFGGFFANGAAFNSGQVTAFAHGGVVNQPTLFPMANGAGLMGEAGPEAIMPLKRGSDGRLGVEAHGFAPSAANSNQPMTINMNVAVDGSMSRAEGYQLVDGMAQQLRREFPGAAVNATTTANRKQVGLYS